MPSRAKSIRLLIEAHVSTAISGVTIINEPVAMDSLRLEDFPAAVVLVSEEEPERLAFKQERRRVSCLVQIGKIIGDAEQEAAREIVLGWIEAIRDAIFADETLTDTVDDVTVGATPVYSQKDDGRVYAVIEVATEEVF
jgi:hypothetical protein